MPRIADSDYIGIPYRETGNTREGCYCIGFCILWWRENLGVEIPDPATTDPAEIARSPFHDRFARAYGIPERGDMILMDGRHGSEMHAGIYTGKGVLHATRESGVVFAKRSMVQVQSIYRLKL